MSQKKVVVITSAGDLSECAREFFSKRYSGMKLEVISVDTDGEVKLAKHVRKGSSTDIITLKDVLSESQLAKLTKEKWVVTVWSVDQNSGKPMYPFTYRK